MRAYFKKYGLVWYSASILGPLNVHWNCKIYEVNPPFVPTKKLVKACQSSSKWLGKTKSDGYKRRVWVTSTPDYVWLCMIITCLSLGFRNLGIEMKKVWNAMKHRQKIHFFGVALWLINEILRSRSLEFAMGKLSCDHASFKRNPSRTSTMSQESIRSNFILNQHVRDFVRIFLGKWHLIALN